MQFAQPQKVKFFHLLSTILFILAIAACLCVAQGQRSVLGELKLEGEHLEQLVLRRKDGHTEQFDKPVETIELPVGQYQLQESPLEGGYVCVLGTGIENKLITIAENKPAILKVGAPLKQTLEVKRRGKAFVVEYNLHGIGDEAYTKSDRDKPPRLVVYNGDEEINSGRFEYG